MTHYIGPDAHSKTCTAVVTDKTGKILQKSQFPTSEKHLLQCLYVIRFAPALPFRPV